MGKGNIFGGCGGMNFQMKMANDQQKKMNKAVEDSHKSAIRRRLEQEE